MAEQHKDQEFKNEDDSAISYLYVREGSTKAFIKIVPKLTPDQINPESLEISVCGWLENILAIDLIDDRALKDALKHALDDSKPLERRIAKGVPAIPGRDAKLILLVKPFTPTFEGEYKLWDRFQKRFDSIIEGQPIARIYPPVLGTDGVDVFGKPIKALEGREAPVQYDNTLSLLPPSKHSFKELVACKSGYLVSTTDHKKNISLKIETVYQIPSDVDHSTGSLDFVGGATIKGSVMKGFQVICKDEIIVRGDVFDAKIESKSSSIQVSGNIIGSEDEATEVTNLQYDDFKWIKARLDVRAKSVEGQAIFAGRSIIIDTNSVRSILSSGSQITVNGALYASRARTVCGIEVNTLGNSSGVHTEIEFLPIEEAGEDFLELEAKIIRLKNREESLNLFLGPYISAPKELGKLSTAHKEKVKNSVQLLDKTKQELEKLELQKDKLTKNTKKNLVSRLNVKKMAHSGAVVFRKNTKHVFHENLSGPFTLAYLWEEDRFEIRALENIDCEWSEQENSKEKK